MRFGRVLTYKDIDEAKRLLGKNVVASENLCLVEDEAFCLAYAKQNKITLAGAKKSLYPFAISEGDKVQFIREVIEDESDPHYEPYDLSDKKVRDSLRGRWFRNTENDGVPETMVFSFCHNESGWRVNAQYYADSFLRDCVWVDDGTPCGRRVDKEMSSPVLTRDGKEDEK